MDNLDGKTDPYLFQTAMDGVIKDLEDSSFNIDIDTKHREMKTDAYNMYLGLIGTDPNSQPQIINTINTTFRRFDPNFSLKIPEISNEEKPLVFSSVNDFTVKLEKKLQNIEKQAKSLKGDYTFNKSVTVGDYEINIKILDKMTSASEEKFYLALTTPTKSGAQSLLEIEYNTSKREVSIPGTLLKFKIRGTKKIKREFFIYNTIYDSDMSNLNFDFQRFSSLESVISKLVQNKEKPFVPPILTVLSDIDTYVNGNITLQNDF